MIWDLTALSTISVLGRVVQLVVCLTQELEIRAWPLILFLLLLIEEGQLSVTGKSYVQLVWLMA